MNLQKQPDATFRALAVGALIGLVASCAGVIDTMTPSVKTSIDDFDGRQVIHQPPISAASSLSEAFHILGFEWVERHPDVIFITAGIAMQIRAIEGVAFNADGQIFNKLMLASSLTHFERSAGGASSRRFQIPLDDFAVIASARVVKMRLEGIDEYTVSSFGLGSGVSAVNAKLGPFLNAVRAARSKSKP